MQSSAVPEKVDLAAIALSELKRQTEIAKCLLDPVYFCHHYCVIDDAQGHGGGSGQMPFKLWPAQKAVMWGFMKDRLTIILKARQLGISWMCCVYAVWHCIYSPGKKVLVYSQGQIESNELIRRMDAIYTRLPDWMKADLPKLTKSNTEVLEFSNGSSIQSLPSTKKAGRSFTASLIIMDEAAHLQWARDLYKAMSPTIDAGGQLIMLSSANGIGNLFHEIWSKAVNKLNDFRTVFLPWYARPERTKAWYEKLHTTYPDPMDVFQEYPANPNEAFVSSGRVRFKPDWILANAHNVAKPHELIPESEWPDALYAIEGLVLYKKPEPGRQYVIGADVAEGLVTGDFSTFIVLDKVSWEEVANYHGHCEPDTFAGFLMIGSQVFNRSGIMVERNNHGHAVLTAFKVANFVRNVMLGPDGKQGFHTNVKTKPTMISLIAESLRDNLITIRTGGTLDECQIYKINDDGTTSAPAGNHDDRVMALGLALEAARSVVEHDKPALTPADLLAGVSMIHRNRAA